MKIIFYTLSLFLATSSVFADSWRLLGNQVKNVSFGDFACEAHSNPTNELRYAKPKLVCSSQKRSFELPIGASKFFTSDDGNFLLGISNSGIASKYAYWVISNTGKFVLYRTHDHKPKPYDNFYCRMTVSVRREWHSHDPLPKFKIVNMKLEDVIVNSCHGEKLSLKKAAEFVNEDSASKNDRSDTLSKLYHERVLNRFANNFLRKGSCR